MPNRNDDTQYKLTDESKSSYGHVKTPYGTAIHHCRPLGLRRPVSASQPSAFTITRRAKTALGTYPVATSASATVPLDGAYDIQFAHSPPTPGAVSTLETHTSTVRHRAATWDDTGPCRWAMVDETVIATQLCRDTQPERTTISDQSNTP